MRSHVGEFIIIMLQCVEALDVAIRQPLVASLARPHSAQCAAAEAWVLADRNV
jgi:hypothetical protein